MEIAQAPSASVINSDWDEVNALFDRESPKYAKSGPISDAQLTEIFNAAWMTQNEVLL